MMKTKVDFIYNIKKEEFEQTLQRDIDAIELNINNDIIKVDTHIEGDVCYATIVYKYKDFVDNKKPLLESVKEGESNE